MKLFQVVLCFCKRMVVMVLVLSLHGMPVALVREPVVVPSGLSYCLAPHSSFGNPTADLVALSWQSNYQPITVFGRGAARLIQERYPELMLTATEAEHRLTLCRILQYRVAISHSVRGELLEIKIRVDADPEVEQFTHERHQFSTKAVRERIWFYLYTGLEDLGMRVLDSESNEKVWSLSASTNEVENILARAEIKQALVSTELSLRAPSLWVPPSKRPRPGRKIKHTEETSIFEEATKIVVPCLDRTVEVFLYHDGDEIHAWIVVGDTQKDRDLEYQIFVELKEIVKAYIQERRPSITWKGAGKRRFGKPVHWKFSIAMDEELCMRLADYEEQGKKFNGYVKRAIHTVEKNALQANGQSAGAQASDHGLLVDFSVERGGKTADLLCQQYQTSPQSAFTEVAVWLDSEKKQVEGAGQVFSLLSLDILQEFGVQPRKEAGTGRFRINFSVPSDSAHLVLLLLLNKDEYLKQVAIEHRLSVIKGLLPDAFEIMRTPYEWPTYFVRDKGTCIDAAEVCKLLDKRAQRAALLRLRDLQRELLGHPKYQDLFYLKWEDGGEVVPKVFSNPESFYHGLFKGKYKGQYQTSSDYLSALMVIQEHARRINQLEPVFVFSKQRVVQRLRRQERMRRNENYRALINGKEGSLATRIWQLQAKTHGECVRFIKHSKYLMINKNWRRRSPSRHLVYRLDQKNIERVVTQAEKRVAQYYSGDAHIEEVNEALRRFKEKIKRWPEYRAIRDKIRAKQKVSDRMLAVLNKRLAGLSGLYPSVPGCISENFTGKWKVKMDRHASRAMQLAEGKGKKLYRWFFLLPRDKREVLVCGHKDIYSKHKIMNLCAIPPIWEYGFSRLHQATIPGFTMYIEGIAAPKSCEGIPFPNETVKGGATLVLTIDEIPEQRAKKLYQVIDDLDFFDPWDGFVPPEEEEVLESRPVVAEDSVEQAA